MRKLTESAIDLADVCLFVIDARVGVTALDHFFADLLRKKAKHIILAANKSEGRAATRVFLIVIVLAWANHCASQQSTERDDGFVV